MVNLDDFRKNGKKKNFRGDFCELSDELTEFDLYIDLVSIVYMFCAKIFFKVDVWR